MHYNFFGWDAITSQISAKQVNQTVAHREAGSSSSPMWPCPQVSRWISRKANCLRLSELEKVPCSLPKSCTPYTETKSQGSIGEKRLQ